MSRVLLGPNHPAYGKPATKLAPRTCEHCGQSYDPIWAGQRFCTQSCGARARRTTSTPPPLTYTAQPRERKTCPQCGREFVVTRSGQQYCDQACGSQGAANKRRLQRVAEQQPMVIVAGPTTDADGTEHWSLTQILLAYRAEHRDRAARPCACRACLDLQWHFDQERARRTNGGAR